MRALLRACLATFLATSAASPAAAQNEANLTDEVPASEPAPKPAPPPMAGPGRGSTRWIAPQAPAEVKRINEKSNDPARVRLGLRLTPFKKVTTRMRNGETDTRWLPTEPIRHTLRARLNKVNHFFVGEWHIETKPTRWVKKSRRYEVRLSIYRRYGAFGQLEENVGVLDLAGTLDEQEDKLFVLLGVARTRLRDKFGNPYLDVVAGFQPVEEPKPKIAEGPATHQIPEAPVNTPNPIIRGRF